MNKKVLALLLTLCMIFTIVPVNVMAEEAIDNGQAELSQNLSTEESTDESAEDETAPKNEGEEEETTTPTGTLAVMYVEQTGDRARVYGEANNISANESVVVKLYNGNTLVGTTSRKGVGFPYTSNELTINIVMSGSASSSWETVWENGAPSAYAIPDKAELIIDDRVMSTVDVKLNGPDDKAKVVGVFTDANGKITKVISNTDFSSDFTATLNAAFAEGGNIVLLRDVELTDTLNVPAEANVVLDLNCKTISQTKEQTTGYQMILNDGVLTINDTVGGGKISYTDSGNGGEYISDAIYNRATLVINGGTIENLSSATVASNGYPHAVDNYSGIRDTSLTINGGTIYCAEYSAIRMFCVSATNKADLVINDGTIKGAVDMQNGTKNAALGSLTINGGTFETTKNANNIRFANWNGGATEYGIAAEIKGGSFNGGITTAYVPAAANWNSKVITGGTFTNDLSAFAAEGYTFEVNTDGTYGVAVDPTYGKVAKVGETYFTSLQEAINAAQAGETVTLINDVELDTYLTIDKSITLDLGEYKITRDGGTGLYVNNADIVVTIKGEGTVTSGEAQALYVNAGTVNIYGGTFNSTVDKGPAVYVINNGNVNIYGGKFSNNNGEFVLNEYDSTRDTTSITVYGGKFVGFNPADNASEGAGTNFVAEGYIAHVDSDENTYCVVPEVIEIYNWEDLKELDALVESGCMLEGVTVKLMNDIDLYEMGAGGEPVSFNPIGANSAYFKGTFDGQGHTIKNMYQSGWALGYDWDNYGTIGLFAYLWNATVKNVTIENAECFVEGGNVAGIAGCAWGNCTFENITIKNSTYATYNNRAAGIVGYTGGGGTMTFKNVTVDKDTVIAALWGSYDCTLGGVVGSTHSNNLTKYVFEDVTVACKLDCYNDVTASYKWYSYRMCGMLIGSMKALQEGSTDVDPRGVVTLKNVDITIGEWANQTYIWDDSFSKGCQRVEAGYSYGGVDVSQYPDAEVETLGFSTIIGGPQSQSKGYYGSDITKLEALEGFETQAAELDVNDLALEIRNRVAQVGETYFTSLQEAVDVGGTVELLADVATDTAITVNKTVVLNLNGFSVSTTENDTVGDGVFCVVNGGDLTINGEGTINGVGGNDYNIAIWANGGKVTINGGTYTNKGATDSSGNPNFDLIYVKNGGEVVINGGTFICETPAFTLNCHDDSYKNNNAKITVKGGTFANFNPADNAAEGAGTNFVADGYRAVKSGDNWIVKENIVLSGAGTATDPYLITNLKELKAFRDYVNEGNTYADKYVKLTADINLTGEVWTPIGTSNYDKTPTTDGVKMFAGNFDGGNHTITGLTSDGYVPDSAETGSTEYSFGLFGYVYGANISNVKLANVDIDCGTRTDSAGNEVYGSGIAALIGYYYPANEKTSVISNCHVLSGTVKASNNMGGLIGHMDSQLSQPAVDITIENCSNAADVTTEAREAGGILGLMNSAREGNYYVTMRGTVTFKNCVNTGDITSLGGGAPSAGGILGRDHNQAAGQRLKIVFDGCENSGTITVTANGETHAAGIGAGYYSNGAWLIAKDCNNTGNVVVNNSNSEVYAGGLISYGGVVELINSTSTGTVTGGTANNTYVGGAQNILFLEKMPNFTDTVNGYTYYLNGGTSPEYAALVDDAAGGGNFHLVETASKDGFEFGGWYDNAELTGEKYTALNNNVKTYYAKWIGPVAKIGDTKYDTLQAAIDAVQAGETVTLITDVAEEIQIANNATVVLDLNGNTLTGCFKPFNGNLTVYGGTIDNNNGSYSAIEITAGTLDIKDVNITSTRHGVRIDGAVTATIDGGTYKVDATSGTRHAVNVSGAANVTIKNGTFIGPKGTAMDSGAAVMVQSGATVTIEGGNFSGGKNHTLSSQGTLTVKGGTVNDGMTIVKAGTISVTGGTFNGGFEKGKDATGTFTFTGGTYDQDPTAYVADGYKAVAENDVYTVVEDVTYVAQIGDNKYESLQAAIIDAQNGAEITVISDINIADNEIKSLAGKYNTYFLVEGKTVTINLNGKKIYGEYTGNSMLVGVFSTDNNGHLTLTGNGTVDVTATATVYGLLVNYEADCSITVENGTYILDKASDSLIYTGGNEDVIINGGTFTLGNVGTGSNGSPWIFNAGGRNNSHVMVYGGTFNANVFNQHWRHEVQCDGKSTITDNGNGTWTVKKDAVAYVAVEVSGYDYLVGYETIDAALEAAQDGQTVFIFAGEYDTSITVNKAITVAGETDADGNNLVTINGKVSVTGNGATVKNLNVKVSVENKETALYINGGNIMIEGCNVSGYNVTRYSYVQAGGVTFKNCVLDGYDYTLHFDTLKGDLTIDGCTLDDWSAIGAGGNVIVKNSTFKVGETEYNTLRTWTNATYDNCTFEKGFDLDLAGSAENLAVTNSKFSDNTPVDITLFRANDTEKYNITVDGIKMSYDAKIGDTYYTTLAEAIAEGGEVVLLQDITLDSTIKVNGTVVLDLNGKTITGTDNATGSFALIEVQPGAELTINDTVGTGKITLEATNDRDFNNYSSVISNQRGKLTVNGGTIEHLGGTDMAYGIDNLTNGKGTYAETVINGGTIKSTYRGIRQFLNGVEAQNILTVNGGTIEGANKSIWMQDPNAKANSGTLTVGENAELKGDVYLYVTPGSTEWPVSVSIAAAALDGESTVITGNVPTGYVVEEANGAWGVREANYVVQIGEVGYESLADAIEAAKKNDTIILINNVTEDVTVNKSLTIDGANNEYIGNISVSGNTTAATVKNVKFKDGTGYAITTNRIKSITVENCTVDNYGFGFLYANKSTPTVVIKNVTVNGGNYGFHWVYGTTATLENVTMTNVTNGLLIQNYASKTITLKNCNITGIAIWERSGYSGVQTFKFEGANTVGTLTGSQYAKYVLVAADATLTAPEGYNVTTNVENHLVKYDNGTYKVIPAVAKIGETIYETVSEALADAAKTGATVTLITNADADVVVVYPGVTLDLNGKTLTANYIVGLNGSDVIDSSADNSGLLKVDKDSVSLDLNNAQLPVWDDDFDGYLFVEIEYKTRLDSDPVNETIKQFRFNVQKKLDWEALYTRLADNGAGDHELSVIVEISWTNGEEANVTQRYVYKEGIVIAMSSGQLAAEEKYGNYSCKLDEGDRKNVTYSVIFVSGTGAEFKYTHK